MGFKYKVSKSKAREYASAMKEISAFCVDDGSQLITGPAAAS